VTVSDYHHSVDSIIQIAHAKMSSPASRLSKITDTLVSSGKNDAIPWDPDRTEFPTRRNLPNIPGPPGAAWVWGPEDGLGRLNLLTPTRVAAAAKEIKTGEVISVKYAENPALIRPSIYCPLSQKESKAEDV
jgi:hypothetical protein